MATNNNNKKKPPRKESKLKKIFKVPIKILTSARDFYMKGMSEHSNQVYAMSYPAGHVNPKMPRSISGSSSGSSTKSAHFDDDYRELLRVASTKTSALGSPNKNVYSDATRRNNNSYRQNYSYTATRRADDNMPRSQSVGFGRIDEETPCEFDEDGEVKEKNDVYPRSRSCAVPKRTPKAF